MLPTDLQRQTLRFYGELIARRPGYGGQLVFTCGEGCSTSGLPAAVSIAGGTTLALDPDASAVKATFRQGGIDFVVNTLDEALRVLKNEVRQHKPLGVGLIAELQPVLAEIAARGVLPDLQVTLDPPSNPMLLPPAPTVPFAGVTQLHLANADGIAAPTETLTHWLAAHSLTETLVEPTTNLRVLDEQLLSLIPADDTVRRHWLQRISHYQRPTTGNLRILWLTPAEQAFLAGAGTPTLSAEERTGSSPNGLLLAS
jgi:urocanate hydratase